MRHWTSTVDRHQNKGRDDMSRLSYSAYLLHELNAVQHALLKALEEYDRKMYIEAPLLDKEYMSKIGNVEQEIVSLELDVFFLNRKIELIQTAINRRAPIDMEAIDKQIEEEREAKTEKLTPNYNGDGKDYGGYSLVGDAQNELQELYREIVKDFHPGVHPEITETQRQLYDKAVEAYRKQNLDMLKVIHEMLYQDNGAGIELSMEIDIVPGTGDEGINVDELSRELQVDYSLAKELYPYFSKLESDAVLQSNIDRYKEILDETIADISDLTQEYPFTTQEMLRDPAKVGDYLDDLRLRKKQAEQDKVRLNERITAMIGEMPSE